MSNDERLQKIIELRAKDRVSSQMLDKVHTHFRQVARKYKLTQVLIRGRVPGEGAELDTKTNWGLDSLTPKS